MLKVFVFLLFSMGVYSVCSSFAPVTYGGAKVAMKKRSDKKLTQSEVIILSFAKKIMPLVHIDPIKEVRMKDELASVGYEQTPILFEAKAIATAILYAFPTLVVVPISPVIAVLMLPFVAYAVYNNEEKKLKSEVAKRRELIERELPQFAGTIRQNLNTTRDVVKILEGYRKICGVSLLSEINKTLNDMKTGNAQRALMAFESRVCSAKLSELIRGLIGVLRGDDQRVYFDMLTMEYQKAQNEVIKKELLKRPDKLKINNVMLLICMMMMFIVAIGMYVAQSAAGLF